MSRGRGTPKQELHPCWPIVSSTLAHRSPIPGSIPSPSPPRRAGGEWPRGSAQRPEQQRGGTFRECCALPAERMFYWKREGALFELNRSFPSFFFSFSFSLSSLAFFLSPLSIFTAFLSRLSLFFYSFFVFFSSPLSVSPFYPLLFLSSFSFLFFFFISFPFLPSCLSFSQEHNYRIFFRESINIKAQAVLDVYQLQRERRRAIPFLHSRR